MDGESYLVSKLSGHSFNHVNLSWHPAAASAPLCSRSACAFSLVEGTVHGSVASAMDSVSIEADDEIGEGVTDDASSWFDGEARRARNSS